MSVESTSDHGWDSRRIYPSWFKNGIGGRNLFQRSRRRSFGDASNFGVRHCQLEEDLDSYMFSECPPLEQQKQHQLHNSWTKRFGGRWGQDHNKTNAIDSPGNEESFSTFSYPTGSQHILQNSHTTLSNLLLHRSSYEQDLVVGALQSGNRRNRKLDLAPTLVETPSNAIHHDDWKNDAPPVILRRGLDRHTSHRSTSNTASTGTDASAFGGAPRLMCVPSGISDAASINAKEDDTNMTQNLHFIHPSSLKHRNNKMVPEYRTAPVSTRAHSCISFPSSSLSLSKPNSSGVSVAEASAISKTGDDVKKKKKKKKKKYDDASDSMMDSAQGDIVSSSATTIPSASTQSHPNTSRGAFVVSQKAAHDVSSKVEIPCYMDEKTTFTSDPSNTCAVAAASNTTITTTSSVAQQDVSSETNLEKSNGKSNSAMENSQHVEKTKATSTPSTQRASSKEATSSPTTTSIDNQFEAHVISLSAHLSSNAKAAKSLHDHLNKNSHDRESHQLSQLHPPLHLHDGNAAVATNNDTSHMKRVQLPGEYYRAYAFQEDSDAIKPKIRHRDLDDNRSVTGSRSSVTSRNSVATVTSVADTHSVFSIASGYSSHASVVTRSSKGSVQSDPCATTNQWEVDRQIKKSVSQRTIDTDIEFYKLLQSDVIKGTKNQQHQSMQVGQTEAWMDEAKGAPHKVAISFRRLILRSQMQDLKESLCVETNHAPTTAAIANQVPPRPPLSTPVPHTALKTEVNSNNTAARTLATYPSIQQNLHQMVLASFQLKKGGESGDLAATEEKKKKTKKKKEKKNKNSRKFYDADV